MHDIVATSKLILEGLSHCVLSPAPECSRDHNEWRRFLNYLQGRDMVKCYCFLLLLVVLILQLFIYFSGIQFFFLVHKFKCLCCILCVTFFFLATIYLFSNTISFLAFLTGSILKQKNFSLQNKVFLLVVTNRSRHPYALSFLL